MITIYTIQSHVFLEQVMYSYKNYFMLKKIIIRLEKILCAPKSNLCLEKLSPYVIIIS